MPDVIYAFRYHNKNKTKCAVCGVARNYYYRQPIGEEMYNFCSGSHLETAKQNFVKNQNINFGVEVSTIEDPTDYEPNTDVELI